MNRLFLAPLLVSLILSAGTQAWADTANKTTPPGTPRVAVINLATLFSKYERAVAVKTEMAEAMKPLKEEAQELNQILATWQEVLFKKSYPEGSRDKYEDKIIKARRRLEDISRTVGVTMKKNADAQVVMLWQDINAAIKNYSNEHGIQLVLSYTEPTETENALSFPNIERKMRVADQGGTLPVFVGPEADITAAVLTRLNRHYREKMQAKAGTGHQDW